MSERIVLKRPAMSALPAHIFADLFATRFVVGSGSSGLSLPENFLNRPRTPKPASAIFLSLSTSYLSIAFNIRRTLKIRSKSSIIQTETNIESSTIPKMETSSQDCQPIGSSNNRSIKTTNGGIMNARISLIARIPKPLTGSSRNCLSAQPVCGASFLIAFRNGSTKNRILSNNGTQMMNKTYADHGPSGGNSGSARGSAMIQACFHVFKTPQDSRE